MSLPVVFRLLIHNRQPLSYAAPRGSIRQIEQDQERLFLRRRDLHQMQAGRTSNLTCPGLTV